MKSIYPLRVRQMRDHAQCLCTARRLQQAVTDWRPITQADGNHVLAFTVFHRVKILEKFTTNSVAIVAYTWPEMADALADSDLQWSVADLQRELDAFLERHRPMNVIFSIAVRILPLPEDA